MTFFAFLPDLLIAYGAYLIATASPGPANLAIMTTAMRCGRRAGLFLAGGVVLGSATWGCLAAAGMSALLAQYAGITEIIRILGGLYLLGLAFKALRSAARSGPVALSETTERRSDIRYFSTGLAIHLTNPKSIFAWLAIIALAITPDAPGWAAFAVVGGCWLLGIVVFEGYAIAFSTRRMIDGYTRFRRWIEGVTGLAFGLAGIKLIAGSR
ncbi:MAG: LysE family transporter [Pseudomonadota bacterium]|nr:LysE family transporter [Pseudomonadota bacterium]